MKDLFNVFRKAKDLLDEWGEDEEMMDNMDDTLDDQELALARQSVRNKEKAIVRCERSVERLVSKGRDASNEKAKLPRLRGELEEKKQKLIEVEKAVNKRKRQRSSREKDWVQEKRLKQEQLVLLRKENPEEYIRIISEDPVLYKKEHERLKREEALLAADLRRAELAKEFEGLSGKFAGNLIDKFKSEADKIRERLADDPNLAEELVERLKSKYFEGEE